MRLHLHPVHQSRQLAVRRAERDGKPWDAGWKRVQHLKKTKEEASQSAPRDKLFSVMAGV